MSQSDSVLDGYSPGTEVEEDIVPTGRFASPTGPRTQRSQVAAQFRKTNAVRLSKLRQVLINATTEEQILSIWSTLMVEAEDGNLKAIQIIFERLFGPPIADDMVARIEALEEARGRIEQESHVPASMEVSQHD